MSEADRKRVDDLKNGIVDVERFNTFKEKIGNCSEIELFFAIDSLGYIIWRIEHDLADGRIDYPEWDTNDKFVLQAEIELAIEQTKRFGVDPFKNGTIEPSHLYFNWYRWWKGYIEGLPKEEWDKLAEIIRLKGDYSMYRPSGDWK